MVSSDEAMHAPHGKKRKHHGKKRKHGMEDNDNSVVEGARPKEIQGEKDAEQMALSVESEDRISQLPDHVIYHILSFLRNVKDAVRTRSLSKRWRTVWFSYALLVFDEQKFAAGIGPEDDGDKEKMFRQYVADSLLKYIKNNLQIHKFLLHMTSFDLTDAPLVDNWLTGAFAQDLKELDLHIGFKDSKRYTLPEVVFISQTLTGLRLCGCILKSCSDIRLPHLQKLYLRKVHLAEHNVTNLVSSCPSIEDLRLIQCSGLKFLFMCHPSLSRVEIHNCNQLKKVCIFAPDLDTFWFCGKKSTPCKVCLEHCKSLKKLTIDHPQVSRDLCKNQLDKFPVLEKLDLCISDKMKSISITGRCLQRIVLKGCKKLSYGQILAPKLASFELKGENMPYFDFSPFCLTDAKLSLESKTGRSDVGLGLTDAKLSLESKTGRSDVVGLGLGNKLWFSVTPFLSRFSREGFKLIMHSNKHIIIHEDLTNIKYPPLHDLNFEIIKSSACVKDILNGLLRTLHPKSVSIVSSSDSKFAEEATSKKKSVIVGPWGGNGGTSWDDGTFTGIREITLVYDRCIDSIRVVYDKNGKPFAAEKHGGVGGNKTAEIKLQYPGEYLISVSGYYYPVVRGGSPVIRSLTFKSNQRTFGPYGVEEGTPFTFSIDGGQVVGFKGRGDWYLDSIAFTLSNAPSKSLFQKVQKGLYRLTNIAPKSSSSKAG